MVPGEGNRFLLILLKHYSFLLHQHSSSSIWLLTAQSCRQQVQNTKVFLPWPSKYFQSLLLAANHEMWREDWASARIQNEQYFIQVCIQHAARGTNSLLVYHIMYTPGNFCAHPKKGHNKEHAKHNTVLPKHYRPYRPSQKVCISTAPALCNPQ